MGDIPERLRGQFVVEVGVRQAWPFMTFYDPSATPALERRLYIDTTFTLQPPGCRVFDDGDPGQAVDALLALNNRTVVDVEKNDRHDLTLRFDDDRILTISGTRTAFTTHDVWWLAALSS
jgi:hypothetical protein